MHILLRGLSCASLQTSLPGANGSIELAFSSLEGLGGSLERSESGFVLREVAVQAGGLGLRYPLARGLVSLDGARLADVSASLHLPPGSGLWGEISAAHVEVPRAALSLGALALSGVLRADLLRFIRQEGGAWRLSAQTLSLRGLSLHLQGRTLRAEQLDLDALEVSWREGSWLVSCSRAELRQASLQDDRSSLSLQHLSLAEGLRWLGAEVRVPKAEASALVVSVTLSADAPGAAPAVPPANTGALRTEAPESSSAARAPWLDARLLDALQGHVHADIFASVRVPILGKRRATHRFRLPLRDGTINLRELESGFTFLEGAFLGFGLYQEQLAFQWDIPLIPDEPKPIVLWPLDEEGLALAQRRLVRLRTLPKAKLAVASEGPKEANKEKSVALERLDLRELDLALSLSLGEDAGLSGVLPWLRVGHLQAQGEVHYQPGQELAPTAITLQLRSLATEVRQLPLGGKFLHLESLALDAIEDAEVTWLGLRPRMLRATLRSLRVLGARWA